jgi:hypothetical protein
MAVVYHTHKVRDIFKANQQFANRKGNYCNVNQLTPVDPPPAGL